MLYHVVVVDLLAMSTPSGYLVLVCACNKKYLEILLSRATLEIVAGEILQSRAKLEIKISQFLTPDISSQH